MSKREKFYILNLLKVFEVCLKFSEERAGFKAMTSPDLIRKSFWIPNEQYETQISLKKGSVPSSIKRN